MLTGLPINIMCMLLQYSGINPEHVDMLRLLYTDIL